MPRLPLIGLLLLGSSLVADVAHAQLVIDKAQAVADPRSDPGVGLCGAVTHFAAPMMPLTRRDEAVALADKPLPDAGVLGRTVRLVDNLNFRNGTAGATGDFTLPNFRDDVFPYSSDAMATPMGDDKNLVVRLRGYFNVTAQLAGKDLSFAVNCDDSCSLRIGSTDVIVATDVRTSPRIIRQVRFATPGLYPVELVHYQNSSTSYLEWALAESAVPQCPSDLCTVPLTDASYAGKFKPVPTTSLFSAVTGSSPGCQECGATGQSCTTGNYCAAGLCQTCNLPDHCGPSCMACPASAHICSTGKCVECTADDQCPVSYACDIPNGKCVAPQPCTRNDQCLGGQVCNMRCGPGLCGAPAEYCSSDDQCPTNRKCRDGCCVPPCLDNPGTASCYAVPCAADLPCPSGASCDLTVYLCRPQQPMVGGCDGCALPGPGPRRPLGPGLALAALLIAGLGVLGWRARRRRIPD